MVALLAAYAAVFGRFRGHKIFLSTSVALMVVPPVTLLVPMFVFMVDTGWVNHLQSVIVFYTGLLVPFGVFFLSSFFRTVPEELIEAAAVEGAGPFTVLRRIVLPLSGAEAFTLVVVQSIWVWNELLIALVFLQNDEARTLMSGLAQFQGRYATNQPLVLAGALISILPIVLLYLSGQRFFVRGLTAGPASASDSGRPGSIRPSHDPVTRGASFRFEGRRSESAPDRPRARAALRRARPSSG